MSELILEGCSPTPLAHYLKGLGVLRLIGEQKDPSARARWRHDRLHLETTMTAADLEEFFLREYAPTPIVAPWNGGSGFHPKDNQVALAAIEATSCDRFARYRECVGAAREALKRVGLTEKPSSDQKPGLLEACRAVLPDHALEWFDAAYLLTGDGPKPPPLLGTGGNDGRLEFTNNFMQQLLLLFDPEGAPLPLATRRLRTALYGTSEHAISINAPIGQFLPGRAGGANTQAGFSGGSAVNPWDFVLMLEGACAFASAAVRRMEHGDPGTLAYPFTVRAVGAGYASSADDDESTARGEIWVPLWSEPASVGEVRALLAEGRARIGARSARNGVDFARAVAGLGVDRGITSFQRYGFQVRYGRTYFAIPIGRFDVRARHRTSLLQEIDGWLDRYRRSSRSSNAPAAASRALRRLESAVIDLCAHGDNLRALEVLVALGRCEAVMASSLRWTDAQYLRPVPPLSPGWLRQSDDGSVELRLAASLASVTGRYGASELPLRRHLEPVVEWSRDQRTHVRWDADPGGDIVWQSGHLISALNGVLRRRLVRAVQAGTPTYPDRGRANADLGDIADFIEGRVNEARLSELLWGCILVDWRRWTSTDRMAQRGELRSPLPGGLYSLLKLCFPGGGLPRVPVGGDGAVREVSVVPAIHRTAANGHGADAALKAIRRLRGSGLVPAVQTLAVSGESARRAAAALLFPIAEADRARLRHLVIRPDLDGGSPADEGRDTHEGLDA